MLPFEGIKIECAIISKQFSPKNMQQTKKYFKSHLQWQIIFL